MVKPKKLMWSIASLSAVAVFVWLLSFTDFPTLAAELNKIPVWSVIFAFIAMFILYVAKAYRFSTLNPNIPFATMLIAIIYQNFFLGLLPFRLGELAYITYLRKRDVSESKLVSDIVVVRSFDIIVVGVFGVFTIPLVIYINFWTYILILGAGSVLLGIVITRTDWLLEKIIKSLERGKRKFSVIVHLINMFEHMQAIESRDKKRLMIASFSVWLIACLVWVPIVSVLTGLNLAEIILSCLIAVVFTLLPVNPPAGIGVVEGGWTTGLMLFEVPVQIAVSTALLSHALAISFVFFYSAVARGYDYWLDLKNKA